ncbi:Rrf2 family transcriptional regulator [Nibrella saemangeumensis]|uniref:Rrf2 family transcriptional regulator n=1 Tax=Nibrella saemangeumensis TaxID=1084526 RepID=A0ABP8NU37_9BACT
MLSKACGYAIRGIIYVALKGSEDHKIGIPELADALKVPQHFMGKIMQNLVRRDILSSTKGPHGGFYTNEDTLDTPIVEVVDAIDGLSAFHKCVLGLPDCNGEHPCPLHHEVVTYRDTVYETLQTRTIRNLAADVENGLAVLNREPRSRRQTGVGSDK